MTASEGATIGQAIRHLAILLERAGIDAPLRESRLIAAHVLQIPSARLTLAEHEPMGEAMMAALLSAAAPRLERRPLSHIVGRRAFFKNEFIVNSDVLDPRPETEALVLAALAQPWSTVLDLGTGSGAILLSLLAERRGARGMGTDLSPAALRVAEANAERLEVSARATFGLSDWFGAVTGRFDLIVSNPPYIAEAEMAGLAPELSFEPRMALTDGADGLGAYRAICAGARAHLVPGGWLMMEIGWRQSEAVTALAAEAGLRDVSVLPDLDGRDRLVTARA
ncbi:MAG: peptide chain release factor N(5)-glutamine methyltransferase [Roseovarius sp.]